MGSPNPPRRGFWKNLYVCYNHTGFLFQLRGKKREGAKEIVVSISFFLL